MNRKFIILGAVVLVLGLGLYVGNVILGNQAAEEVERLVGPKLEELGITYSALSVSPMGGTLTLNDIEADGLSAESVTAGVDHNDLIALMENQNNTLNSLDLDVLNVHVEDDNGREGIDIGKGSVRLEGVLDMKEFQRNPDAFMANLMDQDDVELSISGNDITLRARELKRELGLPSETMALKSVHLGMDKDGDSFDVQFMADAPLVGQMDISAQGRNGALTLLNGDMSIVGIEADDLSLSMGNCSFKIDAPVGIDDSNDWQSSSWVQELIAAGEEFSWSIQASDFVIGGRGMASMARQFGIDAEMLNVEDFGSDASFDGKGLQTALRLYTNVGNLDVEVDMTADDFNNMDDPESVNFQSFEIELSDLAPALSEQVRTMGAAFMEPDGDDGFSFSYEGSAAGLSQYGF